MVTVAGTNIMYANKSIQAQQPEKKNLKQIARLVFAKIRAWSKAPRSIDRFLNKQEALKDQQEKNVNFS